jgi:predicted ATPase
MPAGVFVRHLGTHRLKDIRYPELLYDLSISGCPDGFASLTAPDMRPNNLPISPNKFVGREEELKEVCEVLQRADTRLLTLIGPGGTGKTRLALESARILLAHFADGVFFVPLAPVTDANLVASTVVQAVGIPEFASKTPLETLQHRLVQRELLLILDNFEQIVEAATVVLQLLTHCPKLKILVTSREPLNIRLERQYLVSPLDVPRDGAARDIAFLESVESVRLLLDRVHDYNQQFSLTPANGTAIASLCTHLDGLPLAIELAAFQLKLFTPQSLVENLRQNLEMLAGGQRDLEQHQRTLIDTINWSYRLLTPNEQALFRRLSVFNGGSTIDSTVAIASMGESRADVVRTLVSLVAKNLVIRTSVEGETRIDMLETIHEFARRQFVDTPDSVSIHRLHAEHYLSLAEAIAPGVTGRDQRRGVTKLLNEEDNLRAALSWGIDQRDVNLVSRLLYSLLWLWIPRGKFAEGKASVRRALETFGHLDACRELGLILESAGWLHVLGGDYPTGLPYFEKAYQMFHALPHRDDQVRSKITLGVTCLVLQDMRGPELSDLAIAGSRDMDDRHILALALLSQGIKHQLSGDAPRAEESYEQALQAFYDSDNLFWPGQVLQNLALLRLQAGDWSKAATLACRALEIGCEYDYPMIRNLSIAVLGGVALVKGIPRQAVQFFGAVDASLSDLGISFEPPEQAAMNESLVAAKSMLSAEDFAAAFEDGKRWSEHDISAAAAALAEHATAA